MLHSVKNNPSDIQLNERTMIGRSNRKWKEEITQMKKIYSDTENLKYQTMPISSNCSRRRDEAQDRENVSHLHPDIHSEIEMQKVEDEKEREADLFKWKEAGKRSSVMNKLVSNEELPEYMKRLMSTKNWTYNAHFSNEYHLRNRRNCSSTLIRFSVGSTWFLARTSTTCFSTTLRRFPFARGGNWYPHAIPL